MKQLDKYENGYSGGDLKRSENVKNGQNKSTWANRWNGTQEFGNRYGCENEQIEKRRKTGGEECENGRAESR